MTDLIVNEVSGLRVVAYPGANSVLIAMSVPQDNTANLAGFAIFRQRGGEDEQALFNRLSFDDAVTSETTPQQRKWTPSDQAPFQKFRWVDIPPDGIDKQATYRVCAMYFTGQGKAIAKGAEASVVVPPISHAYGKFRAAFTRGYISSQAYADKFHNAPIRPTGPKTPDFDTKPFQDQYAWLGAGARAQLFAFIDDCRNDKTCKVDVFAYDLDEPDIISAICEFGTEKRLRAVLDNAKLHIGSAVEVRSAELIKQAAGNDNVVQGHFSRFQHNKVFIKRDASGAAQRVLFGSMNFSVRGLYVQANNIIVADDPTVAGYFAAAFDNASRTRHRPRNSPRPTSPSSTSRSAPLRPRTCPRARSHCRLTRALRSRSVRPPRGCRGRRAPCSMR
jgi:PLD-like domain